MSTRLDRLFVLLDTGSTTLIRRSAAEQLGEVVHLHPHELNNLLSKVHNLLRASNWDTRTAACQAVEAIVRNVPQWDPLGATKTAADVPGNAMSGMVLFSQFDIKRVLTCGASLLGSEGNQYDVAQNTVGMDDKEQLLQQRQLLNKRLGLDAVGALGLDSDSLFDDNDLRYTQSPLSSTNNNNSKLLVDFVAQELPINATHMSSRERNVAKRKARSLSKTFTNNGVGSEDACPVKRLKRERSQGSTDSADSNLTEESDEWPFQNFCEVLMNDLFHSSWETRHGAASGLREVIKHHGRGAGKAMDISQTLLKGMNQLWLSDVAIRLLCVLALDRFGDFVSDEVIAPVRETCAQALGATLKFMDEEAVSAVVHVSLQLLEQKEWEIRHGALLGLKYSLAVRQDMTPKLLPQVLPAIMQGLNDPDDDVRAVAASALIPVTDTLVDCMSAQIPVILTSLWDVLCDLDDLTASTNSIMTLLAKLTSHPVIKSSSFMTVSLTELTPRLLPFLRHNIASVRKAALETLFTLLQLHDLQMTCQWILPIHQDIIRHIYQRSFLEEKTILLPLVVKVWEKLLECCLPDHLVVMTVPWLPVWLTFLMHPMRVPYDPNLLIETKHKPRSVQPSTMKARLQSEARAHVVECKRYIGGCDTGSESQTETDAAVNQARLTGARLLGLLADRLCQPLTAPITGLDDVSTSVGKLLSFHLNNKSALQRYVVGHVIYFWAMQRVPCPCPAFVQSQLLHCLEEVIYYDEIAYAFTRLQSDCKDFLSSLKQQGVNLEATFPPGQLLTLETATHLTTHVYKQIRSSLKHSVLNIFDKRQKHLLTSITSTTQEQQLYSIRVLCSLAMAVIGLRALPEKLNPVVRPLMDVIKKEENVILQKEAADCLVKLIQACLSRTVNPNAKVVKNLCNFLCSDSNVTPCVSNPMAVLHGQGHEQISTCSEVKGILTLVNLQKVSDQSIRKRARKTSSAVKKADTDGVSIDIDLSVDQAEIQENQRLVSIQRQGAETALCSLAKSLQSDLPSVLPSLWSACLSFSSGDESKTAGQASNETETESEEVQVQDLVNSLQVLEVLSPALHDSLMDQVVEHLDKLLALLSDKWTAVRHISARVMAALSVIRTSKLMPFIIKSVLPLLDSAENETIREGGMEALANVVDKLGLGTLPYLVLLVIPVLGRMSDQSAAVRMMATHCFATLIRLMPLEAGIPDPSNAEAWLTERKELERHFLEQLLDTSKLDDYPITVPVKAELRKYQQDGVNWLGFLNKYKLHGILCDDMGLGKTLQSICVLASDHLEREMKHKASQNPDCSFLPSIVICPPTLVGHWIYEVKKFIQPAYLNPLMYMGPPGERSRLQKRVPHHNLIVASYEVVRNDIDFFSTIHWNYCILDEGHIIRNGKTKLAKATKQLTSNHRLILSGTPIQNNVLDLWSLFDFLMPGFLGTERQFQARYGKPILQSRDAKSSSKEQEAGSLAMEALHRQVLPFILRRLKDDVLKDLPPKIIQDYYCDLSPLQIQLYEDFARSRAKQSVDESVGSEEESKEKVNHQHIFQALQYLRKVCNHPALVVNPSHPKWSDITSSLSQHNSELRDINHAPKLTALKQLLNDCCIGLVGPPVPSGSQSVDSVPVVNQHRVLLFCQLKSMLDIVETDLLKAHMPTVSYLRLDGSVPPTSRHDIVHRFNSDPSIDMLLLTTHVGGLGLNLTGADTVIFVEHDWNPMKDLQAMDRAHRIGQKKVVNVYRLITRGTLEEKIMGLQKFKMAVANTVISQDNSSLHSMGTDQLLDLFVLDQAKEGAGKEEGGKHKEERPGQKQSICAIMDGLEELWDESQYENEYNMDAFMKSLENAK